MILFFIKQLSKKLQFYSSMNSQREHTPQSKNIRLRKVALMGSTVLTYKKNTNRFASNTFIELPSFKSEQKPYEVQQQIEIPQDQIQRLQSKFKIMQGLVKTLQSNKLRNITLNHTMMGLGIRKLQSKNRQQILDSPSKSTIKQTYSLPPKRPVRPIKELESYSPQPSLQPMEKNIKQDDKQQVSQRQISPGRSKVIHFRNKNKYLYQKMAEINWNQRDQTNFVYQRRIKSYSELLWKVSFSHGIFVDMALQAQELGYRSKRFKAFFGYGNNYKMVKGLLARRYWWTVTQNRQDSDISFIWTQIKLPNVYKAQQKLQKKKKEEGSQIKLPDFKPSFKQCSMNYQGQSKDNEYNEKIMNEEDTKIFGKYNEYYQDKQKSYVYRREKIQKSLIDRPAGKFLIHNHLQNNFYLGNKKALFYSLRQYCELFKLDVFDFIPLTFHIKRGFKDPEYKNFVKYYNKRKSVIVKENKFQFQQSNKSKFRNIWIVKPGENSNRGRGITVIDEVYELDFLIKKQSQPEKKIPKTASMDERKKNKKSKNTFIVQQYIDRPLLYNGRKFDIRLFVLVTNLYGVMRAYWYEDGYLRTSGYEYNVHTFQPEIHLTNDAIQKNYPNYGRFEAANKLSYQDLQRYLNTIPKYKSISFRNDIIPKMKQITTHAIKSVYMTLSPNKQQHNFEIFGLDFMLDQNLKPWLIEVNTNPCLQVPCTLLDKIIPYMVQQSLKLSLDVICPPPAHYPNTYKHYAPLICLETFKYSLIFDSQIQGQKLQNLYKKKTGKMSDIDQQIGQLSEQQGDVYKDDGKEVKLDDFT